MPRQAAHFLSYQQRYVSTNLANGKRKNFPRRISIRSCRHLRTYSHCRGKENRSNPKSSWYGSEINLFLLNLKSILTLQYPELQVGLPRHGQPLSRQGWQVWFWDQIIQIYVRLWKHIFTNRILTGPQVNPTSQSQFSMHSQPAPWHIPGGAQMFSWSQMSVRDI